MNMQNIINVGLGIIVGFLVWQNDIQQDTIVIQQETIAELIDYKQLNTFDIELLMDEKINLELRIIALEEDNTMSSETAFVIQQTKNDIEELKSFVNAINRTTSDIWAENQINAILGID